MLSGSAAAQDASEVLFAKARGLNASMRDSSANIDVAIDANFGFIPYRPKMNGKYLFKRPDKHKVDLQNAPGYLKKYGNVFGVHLPQLERYTAKVLEPSELNGRQVQKVELKPKVKVSDIDRIDLYIDPERGTVPKYDTIYSQGHLYVDIDFVEDQGYWVFKHMKAEFALPSITAMATADYSKYEFNQNLSDSVFGWMNEVYELARRT